jgi:elongation factor P
MNVPVKRGMALRHHGHLYLVENVAEHHSGQMRPAIHIALRDLMDGRHIDRTVDELLPIDEVPCSYRTLQYLYAKGDARVFMDAQTFDEVELAHPILAGLEPFLKEGDEFRVLFAADQPLKLDIPDNVTLRVSDTAPPSHAVGTSGNIQKEALLENGLTVHVPLFIKTGDLLKINTHTRDYLGKVQPPQS